MVNIQANHESESSTFVRCCQHSPQLTPCGPSNRNRPVALGTVSSQAVAPSERMLVFQAKAGCMRSFEMLYAMYRRRVFRTIVSITMNQEDAEDALQQTFLRAFQALDRFECRSSFYSWITRIAINSSLMILRRRRSQPQIACDNSSGLEEDTWIRNIPDPAPDPEQMYERLQQSQRLLVAVKKLRPNERMIMELHLADDPPIDDLADSLNISKCAAKSRLYRARKNVVSILKSQLVRRSRSSSLQNLHER